MVREKLPVLPHRQPLWNGAKHFRVYNPRTEYIFILIKYRGRGGVLLGILGGGVPPGSSNPDPISDQNMLRFSTLLFRPDL